MYKRQRQPLVNPKSALEGVTHIVSSIPPKDAGDPVLQALGDYLQAAASLAWIGYLSTPSVYGDRQGALTRESDAPNPGSARGRRRLTAEEAWIEAFDGTAVAVQVFRLSGIYGPGKRNALAQVKAGSARIIDKPGQVFTRIHVDDIGSSLTASMDRPAPNRVYHDAHPEACPSGASIRHAHALVGGDTPTPTAFNPAIPPAMAAPD